MKHIRKLNKGHPLEPDGEKPDVKAHAFFGCSILFEPGWETDSFNGLLGLCHPWQRDLYGCSEDCWWPAQVPDSLMSYPDFSDQNTSVERDWQNITFIDDADKK